MENNIIETLRSHEDRIVSLENGSQIQGAIVEKLKSQMVECEKIQVDLKDHSKRSEDALNNNTKAMLLLVESNQAAIASNIETTESNRQLTKAFLDFKDHVEKEHDPVIAWYAPLIQPGNDIKGFFRVNKVLVRWLVSVVLTGAALITAFHVIV